MTDKEKAIVMAHTGICMLAGNKFQIFHKYIEDIMGRPIWTHEMGIGSIADEIKEKSKADFIALCADESCSESLGNCDLISREAVLDKIAHETRCYCEYLAGQNNDAHKYVLRLGKNISVSVNSLPSVAPQPEKRMDKRTETHACDLISREWIKGAIHNFYYGLKHTPTEEDIQAYIDVAPSVSTEKTGRWIRWYEVIESADGKSTDHIPHCKCSECGTEYDSYSSQFIKYCNECGAKMQEVEDNG